MVHELRRVTAAFRVGFSAQDLIDINGPDYDIRSSAFVWKDELVVMTGVEDRDCVQLVSPRLGKCWMTQWIMDKFTERVT